MNRVVGIPWRKADPLIYADAGNLAMKRNAMAVVQGDMGQEWPLKQAERLSSP